MLGIKILIILIGLTFITLWFGYKWEDKDIYNSWMYEFSRNEEDYNYIKNKNLVGTLVISMMSFLLLPLYIINLFNVKK